MNKGKLWTIPRPTRSLHDLAPALKFFKKIAEGKKWYGNRELQKRFEKDNPAKTTNVGRYGSGGRTWAALLRVYGLWYDDNCVTLTTAGEVIVAGKGVYAQMVRLIMNFQITSAYSEHQKLESGFRIFPFRFILKLLLDKRVNYLEEDEIALFLLNVKIPEQYEVVVRLILKFRKKRELDKKELKERTDLITEHMARYRTGKRTDSPTDVAGHWKYIKDFANTFVNHIRYLQEVKYDKSKGIISIDRNKKDYIRNMLNAYEKQFTFSTLYQISEKAFAEHYGLRYDRHKASRKVTKPITRGAKRLSQVKNAFDKISKTNLNISERKSMLDKINRITGLPIDDIDAIISENPDRFETKFENLEQSFADYYLDCAKSGEDDRAFEEMTRMIFRDIGFETEKHRIQKRKGKGKPEIDGLAKNEKTAKSGLLECKSGAKYTFPIGDCEKMKSVYIHNFLAFECGGKNYELDFFVYVVGNQLTGLENFKDIIDKTKIPGTVIYAHDLLDLYNKFKAEKITKEEVWQIFKMNKHLTPKDFEK